MPPIPRESTLDSTLALFREGYTFIPNRCRRYGTDIFATRLMLRPAVCITGGDAAEFFYGSDRFTRQGAMPPTTLRLLQDKGSVQLLDGEAHRWRKRMFMSLMNPSSIERLLAATAAGWQAAIGRWTTQERVVLYDEVKDLFCRAACDWAGVPIGPKDAKQRTREFAAMFEGAGTIVPLTVQGLILRQRSERWIRGVVDGVRAGHLEVSADSAVHTIAWHRDPEGNLLDADVATVEVINLLRPTVAVALFVVVAAIALREHPAWRQRFQGGDEGGIEPFVQEVRRFYPFFPVIGGRARRILDWRGYRFPTGTWVILDLYGTNHDARLWGDPGAFRPERFSRWDGNPFTFVPQGGGDHLTDHRCAGEWITIALMKQAARTLATSMRYDVPEQDLEIDLTRMPAIPRSGFVISNVRAIEAQPVSR